ncbi:30S ribosomal protein S24e [Candidatus Bathyarchaeota archaeon]|nr:MAG: 30S ribosomal protein S24e [Candidatus Bathyarchaeota archaeon]
MEVKIISDKYNPLLKRKEITFEVNHTQTGGTPPRFEVRKALAKIVKADLDRVYIRKFETKTGTMIAVGEANVYDTVEQAKLIEPEYIILRNQPPEKPKEEEKAE